MKTWIWAVLAVVLLSGGAVILSQTPHASPELSVAIQRDIQSAQSEFGGQWNNIIGHGLEYPVTAGRKQRDVPSKENGFLLILSMADINPSGADWDRVFPVSQSRSVAPEDFEPFEDHLETARAAAQRPHFYIDAKLYSEAEISAQYQKIRLAQMLLNRRAKALLQHGREEEGVAELINAFKFSQILAEDDDLTGLTIRNGAAEDVQQTLMECSDLIQSPASLKQLRKAALDHLNEPEFWSFLRQAMRAELHTIRNLRLYGGEKTVFYGGDPNDFKPYPEISSGPPQTKYEQAFAVRYMEAMTPLIGQSGDSLIKSLTQLSHEVAKRKEPSWAYFRSWVMTYPPARLAELLAGPALARRGIVSYLAVLEHHRRTGELPASLADVGVWATDPFDGRPLSYRREGDGFVIWSIGSESDSNGEYDASNPGFLMVYPWPKELEQAPLPVSPAP